MTTSYGVNGFTEEHRAAFQKYGTKRIYIAYDRDEAGEKAAAKHAEELMAMGIECFRVQFPKGMDANECALKTQPAGKTLGVFLNGAAWLGSGKRPTVNVIEEIEAVTEEPEPESMNSEEPSAEATAEDKIKPAAKEENMVAPPTGLDVERVFSFAAASDVRSQEEAEARPMPLASPADPAVKIDGDEITITIGPRTYQVLGLEKNTSRAVMRVNVRVSGRNLRGESRLSRRHAGYGAGAAAGLVHQAGIARAGGEGRDDPPRAGQAVDGAGRPAAAADQKDSGGCAGRGDR